MPSEGSCAASGLRQPEQDAGFPMSQEVLLLLRKRKNEDCSSMLGTMGPVGRREGLIG